MTDDLPIFKLFFELKALSPNISLWNNEFFKDNPPRLFRYKMIISILNFLELDIDSFINGTFLKKDDIKLNRQIIDKLNNKHASIVSDFFNSSTFKDELDKSTFEQSIDYLFCRLFEYKELLYMVENFNSGALVVAPYYSLSFLLTNEISKQINQKSIIIDEILLLLLLQGKSKINIKELIRQYDYPQVDLTEVDLEYI